MSSEDARALGAFETAQAFPFGRAWHYLIALCTAAMWAALAIGSSLYWPHHGLVIREIVGGVGGLATMAFVIRPLLIGSPRRGRGLRHACAGALLSLMVMLWVVLLKSEAPSREGAFAGSVFVCGMMLAAICGCPKSRFGAGRVVAGGIVLTALLFACSLLPPNLFGIVAWVLILGSQLASWRLPRDADIASAAAVDAEL